MGFKADKRKQQKASKKEAREAMMALIVDNVENRFNVKFDSDFGGPMMTVMVERDPDIDCNGHTPYIGVFYDSDGNYKVTQEAEA